MAKFRFNLEVLLKHRENIEQKERDALLRIAYFYQLALRQRDTLEQKRRETMLQMSLKQAENPEAGDLEWFRLYMSRLFHEIEENEKRLMKLNSEIQEQKKVVVEAVKKRKVISILRAKRKKEFNIAQDKKEQKEVEEWVAARYAAERQSLQRQIS
ncbi:MAG: flagellar FliJ family protein [Acidobacteria bacterium]|nr:flagellar FliJ family protein [Acidobacteriota bacterium]